MFTLESHKRYLAGPRLAANLSGTAKVVVRKRLVTDPQWLAHPRGVYVLLSYLESTIEAPTLVQASNFVQKFFYNVRRRKGETMTEWVTRHDECLWEASRSLKRVQTEYGGQDEKAFDKASGNSGSQWGSRRRSSFDTWSDHRSETNQQRPSGEVFDDHGRLPEDDGTSGEDARLARALREQWTDEDIQKRDRHHFDANIAEDDAEETAWLAADEPPDAWEDPDGHAAFVADQGVIEEALEVIREKRRTLQEARWRQQQVKSGRKFYPGPDSKGGGKGCGQSKGFSSQSSRSYGLKCLKCAGPHSTHNCPVKKATANVAEEEAEVAFSAEEVGLSVNEAYQTASDGSDLSENIQKGKGVIDCGATATLGSIDAVEAVMANNKRDHGHDKTWVDPSACPTFKFGNNGVKSCISTVDVGVTLGQKSGSLKIHVHDVPQQPILISVKSLRQLGAVVDFEKNEILYKRVCKHSVVPLETAKNGHLLMPLCGDLLKGAHKRSSPFGTAKRRIGTRLSWGKWTNGPGEQLHRCQGSIFCRVSVLCPIVRSLRSTLSRHFQHAPLPASVDQDLQLIVHHDFPVRFNRLMPSETRAELVLKLEALGERVPPSWTVMQIRARLYELKSQMRADPSQDLRKLTTELNKAAKKKANIVALAQQLGVTVGTNMTIAQIYVLCEEKIHMGVPPTALDVVGFGKYSAETYGNLRRAYPQYAQWVVTTMSENEECCWRLKRLGLWLLQQDKMEIEDGYNPRGGPPKPPKKGVPARGSSSQGPQEDSDGSFMAVTSVDTDVERLRAELEMAKQEKSDLELQLARSKARKEM
eukprot:s167_g37.t1